MIVRLAHNDYLTRWYSELSGSWHAYLSRLVIIADEYRGNSALHSRLYDQLLAGQIDEVIQTMSRLGE